MISTPKAVLVGLISAPKDAPFSLLHLFVKLPSFAMLILTPASTSGWIGIWHCPQLAWGRFFSCLTSTLNRFIVELNNIKFDDKRVNVDVKRLKNRPLVAPRPAPAFANRHSHWQKRASKAQRRRKNASVVKKNLRSDVLKVRCMRLSRIQLVLGRFRESWIGSFGDFCGIARRLDSKVVKESSPSPFTISNQTGKNKRN
jgi:hypothetical protein